MQYVWREKINKYSYSYSNHYNYINLKPRFQNICAKNIGAYNMHK